VFIGPNAQLPPTVRIGIGQVLLGDNDHLFLQFRRAQTGMHLQERFAFAFRVQDGRDPSVCRLSEEHVLLHSAMSQVLNAMPSPVIEPGNLPAQFPSVIEHEHLP
jgi:hypothetical protein